MQNRYAGDVGDFLKLGLLRHLAARPNDGGAGLTIGLNWYLAPDEGHNADGKHVAYLDPANRQHHALRDCDPGLMCCLSQVVAHDRTVRALEDCGALPDNSPTHAEMLDPVGGAAERQRWHRRALDALTGCKIVFADPDNGILSEVRGPKLHKFAYVAELAEYAKRGQSIVVYHHHDRSAHREVHARRRLVELAAGAGQAPVAAVIARRGTCRFFLISAADEHRERLVASVREYARRWAPHAEVVWPIECRAAHPGPREHDLPERGRRASRTCMAHAPSLSSPAMSPEPTSRRSRAGEGKTVQIGYKKSKWADRNGDDRSTGQRSRPINLRSAVQSLRPSVRE